MDSRTTLFNKLLFNNILAADTDKQEFFLLPAGSVCTLNTDNSEHFICNYESKLHMMATLGPKEGDWYVVYIPGNAPYVKQLGNSPVERISAMDQEFQEKRMFPGFNYELGVIYPKGLINIGQRIPDRDPEYYELAIDASAFANLSKLMLRRLAAPKIAAKILPSKYADEKIYKDALTHLNSAISKQVLLIIENAHLDEGELQAIIDLAVNRGNHGYANLLTASTHGVGVSFRPYGEAPDRFGFD